MSCDIWTISKTEEYHQFKRGFVKVAKYIESSIEHRTIVSVLNIEELQNVQLYMYNN